MSGGAGNVETIASGEGDEGSFFEENMTIVIAVAACILCCLILILLFAILAFRKRLNRAEHAIAMHEAYVWNDEKDQVRPETASAGANRTQEYMSASSALASSSGASQVPAETVYASFAEGGLEPNAINYGNIDQAPPVTYGQLAPAPAPVNYDSVARVEDTVHYDRGFDGFQ